MAKFSLTKVRDQLMDDEYRYYFQMMSLCVILGVVALVMCIMNIFTVKPQLAMATGAFSIVSFLNVVLLGFSGRKCKTVNNVIMILAILCLFTYFLVTGGTAGFSPHWILLLPSCGMLFFGGKRGSILASVMFLITVFLLWTPIGKTLLLYEYSAEFCMRFPVVYLAFFAVGYIYEMIRSITYDNLQKAQAELSEMSETDALTGLRNRHWFNLRLHEAGCQPATCGAMMLIDLDDFKSVNDRYGHLTGDMALVATAELLKAQLAGMDAHLCRWGGEEFFVYLADCADPVALGNAFVEAVAANVYHTVDGETIRLTVSIGVIRVPTGANLDDRHLFDKADQAMYRAKGDGKNRVVIFE